MPEQSNEEIQAQAQAMLGYLNQALADANARVVNLVGENALLAFRLKIATTPAEAPEPEKAE